MKEKSTTRRGPDPRAAAGLGASPADDGASGETSTPPVRRRWRPVWTLLGLSGLGIFLTWLSSRRIDPMVDWAELLGGEEVPPRAREPFPSTPVVVRGAAGPLHVDDGGSGGLPVLLVHGLGGSCRHWRDQLSHLRRKRRALALDLRGHGRSRRASSGDYGIAGYADDVARVADELGLTRFALVGHSLGAAVALELVSRTSGERWHGRIAGLLLADPNGDQTEIPEGELEDFLSSLRQDPRDEMRWYFKQVLVGAEVETAERVLEDLEATPEDALVESLESSFAFSPVPALKGYHGPVLSVVSDMNTLPYSLHNLLPDLPVKLIAGTSHWLMMDRPEEFNRALDLFLERCADPATGRTAAEPEEAPAASPVGADG